MSTNQLESLCEVNCLLDRLLSEVNVVHGNVVLDVPADIVLILGDVTKLVHSRLL